jgi:outer membrane immunogenic protein
LVWGIEGDFGFSNIKGTDTSVCGASPGCQIENNWLGMARGRIGYAFQQLLVLGTGGAAFGDMKFTNPLGGSEDNSKVGWALGAGVEYAIMGALSIKAEYLYADLGSGTCSPATCGPSSTFKMPINITRMGVNYHF